jgi:adenosylcobinamide-phosphate synthase
MTAFAAGFVLDLIIGDPYFLPHPVRWIGALIAGLEKCLYPKEKAEGAVLRRRGRILVALVLLITLIPVTGLTVGAYLIHRYVGVAVEAVLTCYLLAAKSLRDESMKVYDALKAGDLPAARTAVSMIVGRETDTLDEAGVARAAVETVAENTSDGVIAPMLYVLIGGPILGYLYKAVNTMDSMVGYKNERYEDFGRAAAKTDDVLNFLPSRFSAMLMILSARAMSHEYSAADAWRIFKRDRYNHKSPNSAQTESVCAGALGIRLGGTNIYFGKPVEKPTIGDATREITAEDIKKSCTLMYTSQSLFALGVILCMVVIFTTKR